MESASRTSGSTTRRTPLTERQPRTRQSSTQSKASGLSKVISSPPIPHHESIYPENNLSVIAKYQSNSPLASNKRLMEIVEDHFELGKRDSQISNASTVSNKGKRKTHIGPWQLGRTLGKGATGRVRLAKHAFTGQTAAIKIVSKKSAAMIQSASMARMDNDTTLSSKIGGARTMPFGIEREIVIMKLIEHPNIINLYDIWENRGELYLVLEYVEGGELFDYVMRNGALPEQEAVRLLRQLIAGLSYCHRFNICHRDLKPENLLLDQDHNIKIADFGMAALQPHGEYLTTSCGSPHYAAPEIIQGKQYQGGLADIWSVGIILYAMLNGFLPFDGGDLPNTLRLVRQGEYYISPKLSPEATDLIQKILQKRPKDRITMNGIWSHPLLKKYEKIHASLAAPDKLVGPPPPLTPADCGPRAIKHSELDRELLRNLQILWHGLAEEELVTRLLSEEPNHEKLFYWALTRFRQEQLENYTGDLLQSSSSDYHHVKKPIARLPKVTTRTALHQRRHSQFSIVSEGSKTRDNYYKNPAVATSKTTQSSYDPYRASRSHVTRGQRADATVVIRHAGRSSPNTYVSNGSLPHSSSEPPLPELPSLPSRASQDLHKVLRQARTTYSTISSQNSATSWSRRHVFRKSTSYRRNVVFRHQHQSSNNTTSASKYSSHGQSASKRSEDHRPRSQQSHQAISDSRSTPSLASPNNVLQPRRPSSDLNLHTSRCIQTPWRDETRKVSAELSKICEEAFNRSSISCTSDVSQPLAIDSPATTVSMPKALMLKYDKPSGHLITPTLRDLIERRQRLIDTWGDADHKTLGDLVEMLDKRIAEERKIAAVTDSRRNVSEPWKSSRPLMSLPIFAPDATQEPDSSRYGGRAVSDPVDRRDSTIRMVTPDPSSPMARMDTRVSKAMPINSLKGGPNDSFRMDRNITGYDKRLLEGQILTPIQEDPSKSENADIKKWSWLTRKATVHNEDLPPVPPKKDTPKESRFRLPSTSSGSTISEVPQHELTTNEAEAKKRRWFQKMFRKRIKVEAASADIEHKVVQNDMDEADSIESQDVSAPQQQVPARQAYRQQFNMEPITLQYGKVGTEPSRNWFAKFLRLKPATRILVVQASKARSRKEVVKILREWRKFGVRDVTVEKRAEGDVIGARVDTANYLHIRPVQFVAHVYAILERGKKAHLAVIKFTQEQGAASSFYRVVDTLQSVMMENNLILSDSNKRKAILKSVKAARL